MRIHELEREQWLPQPLEGIFPFFERPENLALITPPWLGFELLCPSPVPMSKGQMIDYRIRIKGIPVRWRSLISTAPRRNSLTSRYSRSGVISTIPTGCMQSIPAPIITWSM